MNFKQPEFREKLYQNRFITLSTPFWLAWFISLFVFFLIDLEKNAHTGKFSSIHLAVYSKSSATFVFTVIPGYVKNRMKKNPSVQRVLNEPLHYSIRSTLCNEINESKNKRNNISPALRWNN